MSRTPFDPDRKEDSDIINQENRHLIYPYIDPLIDDVIYDHDGIDDIFKKYLDSDLGVDFSFWARFPGFKDFMRFLVQYRYRDAKRWQPRQDLTITLHNDASDLPGELSKLLAQLFTYGYYDKPTRHLVETLVADCQRMRNGIITNTLPFTIGHNPRSNQPFIAVKFKDLYEHNMVLLHWKEVIENNEKRRKILYRGSLGLLSANQTSRQVDPYVSPVPGRKRAEQGYSRRGGRRENDSDVCNLRFEF